MSAGPDDRSILGILQRGEISTVFLPAVLLKQRRIVAWEALVRGPEPSMGSIGLLHAARKNGCARKLEQAALDNALEQFARARPLARLWVNLCQTLVMEEQGYLADVRQHIKHSRVSEEAVSLILRLTPEQVDQLDLVTIARKLRPCRLLLTYETLPRRSVLSAHRDTVGPLLKVGRHALRGIASNAVKRVNLRNFVAEAEAVGVGLIAEGIETRAELAACLECGVPLVQGYLFGKPSNPPRIDLSVLESTPMYDDGPESVAIHQLIEPVPPIFRIGDAPDGLGRLLTNHPASEAFPVLEEHHGTMQLTGYLTRQDLEGIACGARRLDDAIRKDVLIAQAQEDVREVARRLSLLEAPPPGVFVLWDGTYQGAVPLSSIRAHAASILDSGPDGSMPSEDQAPAGS